MNTTAQSKQAQRQFINTFERKEKKYVLDAERLEKFMSLAGNKLGDDQYAHSTISSLYYDTAQFTMINRSLEKPLYKEKLRVRAYGDIAKNDAVFVELKKKFKGIVYKRRIQMSDEGAHAYLTGTPYGEAVLFGSGGERKECSAKLVQNVREIDACIARYDQLLPGIMIVVERHSMRTQDGSNVRITFDMDARWRADDLSFKAGFFGAPILPQGHVIMEVKALGTYPLWLVHVLNELEAYPVSCSKVGRAYQALNPVQTAFCSERAFENASLHYLDTARARRFPFGRFSRHDHQDMKGASCA